MPSNKAPLLARDIIGVPTPAIDLVPTKDEDMIIEDWYTDPFERPTASGPAGEQRRRDNLIKRFQERGFHRNRAVLAAEYLMKSKGLYKNEEQIHAESRAATAARHKHLKELLQQRRAARRQAEREARRAMKDLEAQRKEAEKKRKQDEKQGIKIEDQSTNTVQTITGLPTLDISTPLTTQDRSELSIKEEAETELGLSILSEESLPTDLTRITQQVQFTTDTAELDDIPDHELHRRTNAVKTALRKFDLLYGETGLQPPTQDISFNYLRGGPIPVADIKYRSQGHGRLMKMVVRNEVIYGEEGVFEDIGTRSPTVSNATTIMSKEKRPREVVQSNIKNRIRVKKECEKEKKIVPGSMSALIDDDNDMFEAERTRFQDFHQF